MLSEEAGGWREKSSQVELSLFRTELCIAGRYTRLRLQKLDWQKREGKEEEVLFVLCQSGAKTS